MDDGPVELDLLDNITAYPRFSHSEKEMIHQFIYDLIKDKDYLNSESIKIYLNNFLKYRLKQNIGPLFLNPFLLRLFKDSDIYNQYKGVSNVLPPYFKEYFNGVQELVSLEPKLAYQVAEDIINNSSFSYNIDNKCENYILDKYIKDALRNFKPKVDQIFTISKYLILKESALKDLNIYFEGLTLREYLRINRTSSKEKLKLKYNESLDEVTNYDNRSTIFFHLDEIVKFMNTNVSNDKVYHFLRIIYQAIGKVVYHKKAENNLVLMNNLKRDLLIKKEYPSYAYKNMNYFPSVIEINNYCHKRTLEFINTLYYYPGNAPFAKYIDDKYTKEVCYPNSAFLIIRNNFNQTIDNLVYDRKINIKEVGFNLEYNSNGKRKDLKTLLIDFYKILNKEYDENIPELKRLSETSNSCVLTIEDREYYNSVIEFYIAMFERTFLIMTEIEIREFMAQNSEYREILYKIISELKMKNSYMHRALSSTPTKGEIYRFLEATFESNLNRYLSYLMDKYYPIDTSQYSGIKINEFIDIARKEKEDSPKQLVMSNSSQQFINIS